MSEIRCDHCKWWRSLNLRVEQECQSHEDDCTGKCYRFPPVPNAINAQENADDDDGDSPILVYRESFNWMRPATTGADFCGEFAPIE